MVPKKIAVLGGKESGTGAAVLARCKGFEVFLSDQGKIKPEYKRTLRRQHIFFEEGKHSLHKILSCAFIVKSPGIPEEIPVIRAARRKRIPVYSEIEFASRFSALPVVAITGTNGKTTTTSLTYHILKQGGINAALAGNIGRSFAGALAEDEHRTFVLEISNFQLDDIVSFRPHIAVLMNITPDHLDRYQYKYSGYIRSKFRITENQQEEDFFVYNADDEVIRREMRKKSIRAHKIPFSIEKKFESDSAFIHNQHLIIQLKKKQFTMPIRNLALLGKHNLYNSLASAVTANLMGISKESIRESLANFQNVEHRMEHVCTIHDVAFVNDSKATNVNSTWYALECTEGPITWILGGVDKGNDYAKLTPLAEKKVKGIVCLGLDNKKIHQAFGNKVPLIVNTTSMEEAVKMAFYISGKEGTVLLSPACASFDLFENFEDRGRQFKKAVRTL